MYPLLYASGDKLETLIRVSCSFADPMLYTKVCYNEKYPHTLIHADVDYTVPVCKTDDENDACKART